MRLWDTAGQTLTTYISSVLGFVFQQPGQSVDDWLLLANAEAVLQPTSRLCFWNGDIRNLHSLCASFIWSDCYGEHKELLTFIALSQGNSSQFSQSIQAEKSMSGVAIRTAVPRETTLWSLSGGLWSFQHHWGVCIRKADIQTEQRGRLWWEVLSELWSS